MAQQRTASLMFGRGLARSHPAVEAARLQANATAALSRLGLAGGAA